MDNRSTLMDYKRRHGNHDADAFSAINNNTNQYENGLEKKTIVNNSNKNKRKKKNKAVMKASFDNENWAINNNSNILFPQQFTKSERSSRFDFLNELIQFIKYWWFRYLMVTELYMVEKWERVIIHIILSIMFGILWIFNYSILLSVTGTILGIKPISNNWDQLHSESSN